MRAGWAAWRDRSREFARRSFESLGLDDWTTSSCRLVDGESEGGQSIEELALIRRGGGVGAGCAGCVGAAEANRARRVVVGTSCQCRGRPE